MPWHKRETLAVTHMKVHWVSLTILYILVWPHQLIFYSAVLVWTSGGLPPSTWWQIQLTKNSLKISLKSICMCANDSQNVTTYWAPRNHWSKTGWSAMSSFLKKYICLHKRKKERKGNVRPDHILKVTGLYTMQASRMPNAVLFTQAHKT